MQFNCRQCKKSFNSENFPDKCPLCDEKYFDKPDIERTLFHLQDKYFENFHDPVKSQKYITQMMILIEETARNLLISILKKKGTFVSKEEIEDMTSEVVIKMLTYFRRSSFRIGESFTGYIRQVILFPLYNKRKKEKDSIEVSLSKVIKTDSEGKQLTLQDKLKKQNAGYIYSEEWMSDRFQETLQIEGVMKYLEEAFATLTKEFGVYSAVRVMIGVISYIEEQSNKYFDYMWSVHNNEVRRLFEHVLWGLRYFIKDEILGNIETISIEEYAEFSKRYKIKKEDYVVKGKYQSYTKELAKKYGKKVQNE